LKWTTELERGSGSYESSFYRSSRMYGQVAEAMLNFGYFGVPLAFAVLGFVVGKIVGFSDSLAPEDARRLVLPGMIICSIHMFVQDSENILYFGVKYLLLPVILVFFLSRRRRVRGKRGLAARMARAPILRPAVCPEVSESNWEHAG